jgi:hypothetical protein
MTRRGDPGQDSQPHHANDADSDPPRRHMEKMRSNRQPHDENHISDQVHASGIWLFDVQARGIPQAGTIEASRVPSRVSGGTLLATGVSRWYCNG